MSPLVEAGLAKMRALAAQLPEQLLEGFAAGQELRSSVGRPSAVAFAVGMGGSAIAADLVRVLTEPECDVVFGVVRGPSLPAAVRRDTLVFLVSYSGNTWETLAAYDEAGRRGARRIAITSGGELARRAARHSVPHLQLPPGLPPRSAAGFMLGGLLGLLDPFFPESNETRLRRAARHVGDLQREFEQRGQGPARLAQKVGRRVPYVYAESAFSALARRWKTQVEENAKRLAYFDEVPELFHNAIVGWDAVPSRIAKNVAVILLEWAGAPPTTARSYAYLASLLRSRGVPALRVPLRAEDRLEALLVGLSFGDHFSLFLADSAKVDPYPVDAITRLKKGLERR